MVAEEVLAAALLLSSLQPGLFLISKAAPVGSGDVIVKPTKQGTEQIGVVIIQGAQITPDKYLPLINHLQNSSRYSIWAGVPEFPLDVPEPPAMASAVERILNSMADNGMPKNCKLFFVAHSLGGVMLQEYLNQNPSIATGQILLGSFLLSKYRNTTYPVPTMTIGGDLDGLSRVTRIMEEYYFRIQMAKDADLALANFPVMVIRGLSHLQFASGAPPMLVKMRDLKPELSNDAAHQIVAGFISDFTRVHMGDKTGLMPLVDALHGTSVFLAPIIAAYKMEGFYTFKPPCNSNPPSSACTLGSPWSEHAQQIMGGLTVASLNDSDAFHPVYQINPVHLPHINTNCTSPPIKYCILQTNTVTQNVYETGDSLDTGLIPTSAHEMRVKLKSRQAVMLAAGHKNVDFNQSDGSSICKVINQASYDWAIKNADPATLARFQKYGVQIVMGEDEGPYNEGPLWIWKPLDYTNTTDKNGRQILVIKSVMMRTPVDYFIKAAAGMHYCKLLSPARALEWIYVDGLRKYYGINN